MADRSPSKAFRFKDLPREIRDMIYELYFDPGISTIRMPEKAWDISGGDLSNSWYIPPIGQADRKHEDHPPTKLDTILLVDRQTFKEASAILTNYYAFHFSPREETLYWPAPFTAYMSTMKHLSLEYTEEFVFDKQHRREQLTRADISIAALANELLVEAPQLRTFELCILTTTWKGQPVSCLPGNGAAAKALRALATRVDRLTVVGFGPRDTLGDLRHYISACTEPGSGWEAKRLETWPHVVYDGHTYKMIMDLHKESITDSDVWAWSIGRTKLARWP